MTVLEELIDYSNKCLNDVRVSEYEDYISCKKHKWACKRFLDDIERSKTEECFFYWDEDEARNIVDWFSLLRHSKGELAGKPIVLNSWQKFVLCQLYGWRIKDTGFKRFRQMFTEVGRKNAKSQMLSGINLYEISVSSKKNNEAYEAYTAGTKRDQSKIIFNECKLMLNGSPLHAKFKVTRDIIKYEPTESFVKPLCKEDGQKGDGTNPAILTLDEYHQHKTTEFYDLFLGANVKDPTLVIITTAGTDLTFPCYTQEYQYCSKVLDPNVDVTDDSYLIDILELDEEDYEEITNLSNERLWNKANPIRMTYEGGRNKLRDAYKRAKEMPEKMTAFMTKMLNIWVQATSNGYMDMAKWKKCEVEKLPVDTKGMSVYVGFDMSAKIDLTSVSFIIPFQTGKFKPVLRMENGKEVIEEEKEVIGYIVYSHSFIPNKQKQAERISKDKMPYDAWVRSGYITLTNTEIVDQDAVMRYVLSTCKENEWHIESLDFDPANASKLMMDFSNQGFEVEEVYQSHKSLNEATQGFREEVYQGNIYYLPNPVLNFAMSNAVTTQQNGLIKVDKDHSVKRIDPVDSTLCGFKIARYHDFSIKNRDDYINKFLDML